MAKTLSDVAFAEALKKKTPIPFEWEEIAPNTFRGRVFGGWLIKSEQWRYIYNTMVEANDYTLTGEALTFVPDPNQDWEVF